MTEPVFYKELDTESEIGYVTNQASEVYIPKSYGAEIEDRFEPHSGEFYIIQNILTGRYPGSDVLVVSADTR